MGVFFPPLLSSCLQSSADKPLSGVESGQTVMLNLRCQRLECQLIVLLPARPVNNTMLHFSLPFLCLFRHTAVLKLQQPFVARLIKLANHPCVFFL